MASTAPAQTYPVLGNIIADVKLDPEGRCEMSADRFQHWGQFLTRKYPRQRHPKLYQMLGGMTLEFAQLRAFAAVQLLALATLGMPMAASEALAAESEFLRDQRGRHDTLKLSGPLNSSTLDGIAQPSSTRSAVTTITRNKISR